MQRHTQAQQVKLKDRKRYGAFFLSQLNKFVFVLLMGMIFHLFPIHNARITSDSASIPKHLEPHSTEQPASSTSILGTSLTPSDHPAAPQAANNAGTVNWARMITTTEIRSLPDPNKPVILIATANETLPVLQQSGDWIEVGLTSDQRGWIRKSEASVIQTPYADTQLLLVKANSSLYWGPDSSFGQADRLTSDTSLIPKRISGQWIEVAEQQDGNSLWVPTSQAFWSYGEQPAVEAWSRDVQALSAAGLSKLKLPMQGKKIVIDPGHGGSDPGAIAQKMPVYERDINLASAQVLANKLKAAGANVIMTRTSDDQTVSLQKRTQVTNQNKPDVFVSIHQNMYELDPNVSGTITYYDSPGSKLLAQKIEAAATKQLNSRQAQPNEQIEKEQLYVLKHTTRPAVLIEGCFLSNPSELTASLLPSYYEKLATGIYLGILAYLQP